MKRGDRLLRQTLTIARRDFVAIVFTPTFLIFLLAPLMMVSFGAIGGLGAASLTDGAIDRQRIVAFTDADTGRALIAADARLRALFREDQAPPPLVLHPPVADPARTARAMLADGGAIDVSAILTGPLASPTIYHGGAQRSARYLALAADTALRDGRIGTAAPLARARVESVERSASSRTGRQAAGFAAVFVIFFLTLLLAGQSVGMLAEERNSKVIEVLAAAVPLEAVFFGKLIGMFGVAVLFVAFWGGLATQGLAVMPAAVATKLPQLAPAVGLIPFLLLFAAYFTFAFLLLGAVFLGVGAQAGTMREIQMLSLPVTIVNVAMFGLAAAGAAKPGGSIALIAEIFPFSSPYAMAARAANRPELWPHLLALAWQMGWLALTITLGARAFRRGVLQSGGGFRLSALWKR